MDLVQFVFSPLPIDPIVPRILSHLEKENRLILSASPGSGKTTRIPAALLNARYNDGKAIYVLEPRRLAAKLAAGRVAYEMKEKPGQTVGYQFRLEKMAGEATRLLFLTEGMLLRKLQSDPTLSKVGTVILDEFHERSLQTEVALAYLLSLQKKRPDLRIIVMSATLDSEALQKHLAAEVISVEASRHPLKVEYGASKKYLEDQVKEAVVRVLRQEPTGDILVFLPGMGEIRRCEQKIQEAIPSSQAVVYALHSETPKELQERAVTKQAHRKVILSTNVAESSVTIDGVSIVIDTGLHRQSSFNAWTGLSSLQTRPISQASAIQRAGRAARQGPGLCLRLYSEGEFKTRLPFDAPEIVRAELSQMILEIKALGVNDVLSLPWFEPPRESALEASRKLLFTLGALNEKEEITPLGKKIAEIPAHPRIARLLLEAEKRNVLEPAANLAALINDESNQGLDIIEEAFHGKVFGLSKRTRDLFLSRFREVKNSGSVEDLKEAALCGFPDRVARLREGRRELVLCQGGTANVPENSLLAESSFFLILGAFGAQGNTKVTALASISEESLLLSPLIEERDEIVWDAKRKCAMRKSILRYGQLPLSESEGQLRPEDSLAALDTLSREVFRCPLQVLEEGTKETWIDKLNLIQVELEPVLNRCLVAGKYQKPELGWTEIRKALITALKELSEISLRGLSQIDWGYASRSVFSDPSWLDRFAPESIQLPSGRKTKVFYESGKAPWVVSRLQDFFGMTKTPVILGNVPLTLHLTGPNQRPLQITSDLAGFWERDYPRVRKELSRRYPRHKWPENPLKVDV